MMATNCELKEENKCPHADESAERAVKKVFAILGVNIDDPQSIEEFRQDLRFGARLRRISDRVNLVIIVTVVVAILSGALSILWDHIKN